MHLLGIDSKTMSATEFYEKCDLYNKGIGTGITIGDCTPSRNVSQKYKIVFVLKKRKTESKFREVLMEVKKGLFEEQYDALPEELRKEIVLA